MKFTKMHGIGNDYVYMDCTKERLENPGEIARLVSDRHKGIGSRGIVSEVNSTIVGTLGSRSVEFRTHLSDSDVGRYGTVHVKGIKEEM